MEIQRSKTQAPANSPHSPHTGPGRFAPAAAVLLSVCALGYGAVAAPAAMAEKPDAKKTTCTIAENTPISVTRKKGDEEFTVKSDIKYTSDSDSSCIEVPIDDPVNKDALKFHSNGNDCEISLSKVGADDKDANGDEEIFKMTKGSIVVPSKGGDAKVDVEGTLSVEKKSTIAFHGQITSLKLESCSPDGFQGTSKDSKISGTITNTPKS
ncbi:hypothetical protein IU500_19525 [Nocardia terpenica]|uniref:hypothetical protein n=1 Tax=Nocardia terpenica TaxID=455432 RepID=UPI001896283D|nr:hypothetical protein [Nocardia terpenica]MBF6061971.1 hypothetical protein [Nocardia terpenica]MBF6106229.1 hypothetical protein [Nocardia terpenica]MBF6110391.1 hypothetical protein [Nocardia terpenica]MBF6120772.1 hypothetical protein [Nocardia terpenica]MBF6151727.1 hypothetical protein [Nocardia terpenica]